MAELPGGLDWNSFRTAYAKTRKSTKRELKKAYNTYKESGRSRTSPTRASPTRASPTRTSPSRSKSKKPSPPRKESVGRSPPKGTTHALPAPRRGDTHVERAPYFEQLLSTLEVGRFDRLLTDAGIVKDVEEADVVTVFIPVGGFEKTFSKPILDRLLAGDPIRLAGHPIIQRVLKRHVLYRTMPTTTESVALGEERCTITVTDATTRIGCPGMPVRRVGESDVIANGVVYYIARPLITGDEEFELGRLVLETHPASPELTYREKKLSTSPRKVKTSLDRPRAVDSYNVRTAVTVGEGMDVRYVITEPYAISVRGGKPQLLRMTEKEWIDVEDKFVPLELGLEGVDEDQSILERIDATLERILVDHRTHTVAFVLKPDVVSNERRGGRPISINVVLDKLEARLAYINTTKQLLVGNGRKVMIGISREELE